MDVRSGILGSGPLFWSNSADVAVLRPCAARDSKDRRDCSELDPCAGYSLKC